MNFTEFQEAVYGGDDAKRKAEYEKRLKTMLPKRGFDQLGREIDPRSGKVLNKEEKKPLPLDKMLLKALSKDLEADKEKDSGKKAKLEDQARVIQMTASEEFAYMFSDPLEELYDLAEAEMNVMPKPDMASPAPPHQEAPNKGDLQHPVTKQRREIDSLIAQGENPIKAHQAIHGELNPSDTTSKAKLASTLGRLQDDGVRNGVVLEPEKGSILSKDAELEKELDQVTPNDLSSPMNQQVPDQDQTAATAMKEDLEMMEDFDYNDDVAFLQKYGRA
jgi:hypothetical protein